VIVGLQKWMVVSVEEAPVLYSYVVVLLKKGPSWSAEVTPESEALQAAHLGFLRGLYESGQAVAMGPTPGDGELRGITILRGESVVEALALAGDDPAVRAGRFLLEAHLWLTPVDFAR
jgi:uncharacterized protein YciI